ncbi:hypothetical protein DL95DRAFT_458263 [Leptodontidium sp. 2 PMI_412]|nr:hypothetical protein DL95DRAFT_458263 [Leptodontidium sp. 2 PMI_412]
MEASEVLRTSFKPVSHSQTAPPPNTAQQSTALPSLSNSVTKSPDSVPSKGYSTSLYGRPSHPESTRVLNHPNITSESTDHELERRYPGLKYHAEKACALSGYLDPYLSLNLHPETSIAEEAPENSRSISEHIIAQPTKISIMNDYGYTSSINLENPG